ncbi:Metalloendopeptidase PEX [Araneus ventricosus]|uniref:Metalloendopeptidase PEX n=1 Tax=Araneus ventricosus TaxID=182803 RepID=A0A4Y2BUP2_ARAVE|nr:Metalloendopeptidase PEX [Araneus ventricosus]
MSTSFSSSDIIIKINRLHIISELKFIGNGCAGWFEQRTNLEKTLISVSCLLLLTLVLLILVGIAFKGNSSSDSDAEEKNGCWSLECIKTTGNIVSLMDERWDPCSNFYDYACGSFSQSLGYSIAQNSIDSIYFSVKDLLESSSSTSMEELDSLKSFYGSCMDFEGLHSKGEDTSGIFLELMDRYGVGSWPVLDDHYESQLSLAEVLSALTIVGIPVAFRAEVVPDNQVKGSYLLKLSPGGPLESGRSAVDIRSDQDLKTYMLFSFLLLGTSTYAKSIRAVDDILGVDAYYANVEQDNVNKCDTVDVLAPDESLERLNNIIPEMEWNVLFESIQKEAGLNRPFAVEVHCKAKIRDYVIHLNDLVDVISQNYFGWRFFQSFAKHAEPTLRKTQPSAKDDIPRWKECVMLIEKHAAPLLAQGLSSERIKKETEEKVQEMTTSFRSTVEELVSKNRWLKKEKKAKILRQIQSVKFRLPYGKKNATRGAQGITMPRTNQDNYTLAVIELRKQSIIRNFKKLNPSLKADESSELWNTMLTSASHIPTGSSLPVYFDKIQEPYLRLQGPKGLNYGSFGTFLAREWSETIISENVGVSANDHTSIWDLWTNDASGCVTNLFSKRFGLNSEAEREKHIKDLFLDIGSLEIALESARSGTKSRKTDLLPGFERSDDQMFFIAYAQTQCEAKRSESDSPYIPIRERVNTIVSSSNAFAEAFTCSSSSSSSKCHIWT